MLADLLPLFEHDHRASMEMMRAVAGGGKPPAEAVRLMAHVAATKSIYLDRMRGEAVGRTIFPPWGMEEICASLATVQTGRLDYLRALTPELRHSPNEFESLSRGGRFRVSHRVTCVQVVLLASTIGARSHASFASAGSSRHRPTCCSPRRPTL